MKRCALNRLQTFGTALMCAALAGCGGGGGPAGVSVFGAKYSEVPGGGGAVPVLPAGSYRVVYEITGTAQQATATLTNATGGQEQHDVPVPWQASFVATKGAILVLSASNNTDAGAVTATIYVDGKQVKTSSSTAAFGTARTSHN